MTFSIVALCPDTSQIGVAATTAVPAVGKLLTHAAARIGAVATQAKLNPYLGIDGIDLLQQGLDPETVRARLCASDPVIETRQFAVLDRHGATAAFTGASCLPWAGHQKHNGFSVQGNRLAGPQVLHAIAEVFKKTKGTALADRFIAALAAGDAAGGDRKGERSATIYIVDREAYPLWDIRVDYHPDPVAELKRLQEIFARKLLPEILRMPTRDNPAGQPDEHSL